MISSINEIRENPGLNFVFPCGKFSRGRASERQSHVEVVRCCFSLEAYSRLTARLPILSAAVREECDRSSNRSQQARGDDLGNGNFVWDSARLTTRLSS